MSAAVSLPIVTKAQNEVSSDGLTRAQVLKQPLISGAFSIATATGIGFIDSTDAKRGLIGIFSIPLRK